MERLHHWFFQNRREFPWRSQPTPYRVLVSEIMLQQTRASVVIPYFLRWMEQFPDIQSLALSPLEAVIKAWEGLGYYSRVRNLHATARQVVERFGGEIPGTSEELKQLKGLGPYTIGALLNFAFHKRAAAVDGNVVRVLSRYFAIEENVSQAPVRRKIEQKVEELLDSHEPWVTSEALIELGATLCIPHRPRCEDCPLQSGCLGLQTGKATYLPIKKGAVEAIHLHRTVLILSSQGKYLVKKGEAGKVMADLYEFPFFERGEETPWGLKIHDSIELPRLVHTFTRYKAHLYPRLFQLETPLLIPGHNWFEREALQKLPFSSGHRKIMRGLCASSI